MPRNRNRDRLRPIIFIGYFVLFILTIAGIYRIYKDLINYSEVDKKGVERKELSLMSNTLVELFNTERVREALYFNNFNAEELTQKYEESGIQLEFYIDSLYRTSEDEQLHAKLDSLSELFFKKKENLFAMIGLMDTIAKLPQSHFISTTVLSQKELADLSAIVTERMTVTEDTTYYIQERKTLGERIRSVFIDKGDSTKVVTSSSETVSVDTLDMAPSKLLTDTLEHFINDINRESVRKKAAYMLQLSRRQNEMSYFDESLSAQISGILHRIEANEEEILEKGRAKKESLLKRSSKNASRIGLIALAVLLLFLLITYLLLKANQRYRLNLEENNQHIRGLLKSRDKLLLMISHDVKAPLSSIVGHIELLDRGDMPQQEKAHLESMRSSSEQILELSNKLIDHHRFEKEDPSMNIVSFEAYKLMQDLHKAFEPVAKKKNIELISNIDIEAGEYFESDPFMIRQIVDNLVFNAIKFTKEGTVRINSQYDQQSNMLNISIKDTGVGIKKEEQATIFLAFERAGSTDEKLEVEGSGLGLQIVHKLVDLLNGSIALNSIYGEGSEFRIEIPLTPTEKLDQSKKTVPKSREAKKLNAEVLMVDDETTILSIYSRMLELSGARVSVCSDASKVTEMLSKKEYDIIFTDIQMPGVNGFELVEKIRALGGRYSSIPVVALSGRSDLSESEFKTAGFSAFLAKPVPFKQIEEIVIRVSLGEKPEAIVSSQSKTAEKPGFEKLIEYVKDDKELSLEILNTFLEENRVKLSQLQEAKKTKDFDTIQSVAHKLLPLMNMIGEKEMLPTLELLEKDSTDISKVDSIIKKLENVIEGAESYINAFSKQ